MDEERGNARQRAGLRKEGDSMVCFIHRTRTRSTCYSCSSYIYVKMATYEPVALPPDPTEHLRVARI